MNSSYEPDHPSLYPEVGNTARSPHLLILLSNISLIFCCFCCFFFSFSSERLISPVLIPSVIPRSLHLPSTSFLNLKFKVTLNFRGFSPLHLIVCSWINVAVCPGRCPQILLLVLIPSYSSNAVSWKGLNIWHVLPPTTSYHQCISYSL